MSVSAYTSDVINDYSALVARIEAGDSQAEIEFIQRFQPGILALVRRKARPGDPIVDDLVQDVLQHLIQKMRDSALNNPKALPAYIRSTAVNMVIAEYRRRGRRGEYSASVDVETLQSTDDPSRNAQRDQLKHCVRVLLAELPVDRDREVLRRFYLDEQDRDTVCTELNIDTNHFRRVLHRARQRLKVLLQRSGIGELR